MKTFFLGEHFFNCGPSNVNHNLLGALGERVLYREYRNKYLRRIEQFFLIVFSSKVMVCSGLYMNMLDLRLVKILRKRLIYIMHGSHFCETGFRSDAEEAILKYADLILCVSQTYRDFMATNIYPMYDHKMKVLANAINWRELRDATEKSKTEIPRDSHKVVLIGGGRVLKRNLQVCKAVEKYNATHNEKLFVDVYGYILEHDDTAAISAMPNVKYHKVIPHEQLLTEFRKSILFVQNSEFEPFSLGVVESLVCGCNLLVSKNVGAKDVIQDKNDMDVIQDVMDIDEIEKKIEHVLKEGNNKRLLDSIDRKTTSIEYSAEKLLDYIKEVKER